MQDNGVISLVKCLAKKTRFDKKAYLLKRLESHFLRVGEGMALKLNSINIVMIEKYGRWTSNTFITCIHEQIMHLVLGILTTMAKSISFIILQLLTTIIN